MRKVLRIALIVILCGFVGPIAAEAGTLAVDFTSVWIDFTNNSWSLGWEFNVVGLPIQVTKLGFYDDFKDGLTQSHQVGIWDSSQNLLVSATVAPGDPLVSWWRWTTLTSPVWLPVGDNYRIAAVTGDENYTLHPSGFVTGSEIVFVTDRWSGPTWHLTYPVDSNLWGDPGFFGPNFQYVPIPEPSTWGLFGLGLVALRLVSRRSQRS